MTETIQTKDQTARTAEYWDTQDRVAVAVGPAVMNADWFPETLSEGAEQ